ncbi:MAG: DUF3877 family protein [Lachnotalea sp.]
MLMNYGYRSETIRLYYPMESINNLLGTDYSLEELIEILNQFIEFVSNHLGNVTHSNVNSVRISYHRTFYPIL